MLSASEHNVAMPEVIARLFGNALASGFVKKKMKSHLRKHHSSCRTRNVFDSYSAGARSCRRFLARACLGNLAGGFAVFD
jgi:hypothetical protein